MFGLVVDSASFSPRTVGHVHEASSGPFLAPRFATPNPKKKPYQLINEKGLCLLVTESGSGLNAVEGLVSQLERRSIH